MPPNAFQYVLIENNVLKSSFIVQKAVIFLLDEINIAPAKGQDSWGEIIPCPSYFV